MARIGDVLRKTRLEKGLSLEMTSRKTNVPQAYLLAMELNNFEVLPRQEKSPLEQYAAFLGLNLDNLEDSERNYLDERVSLMLGKDVSKTLAAATKATEQSSDFKSRSNRTGSHRKTDSKFPLLIMSFISGFILLFVGLMISQQFSSGEQEALKTFSKNEINQEKQEATSQIEQNKPQIAVSKEGSELVVTVREPTKPLTIGLELVEATEAWFSVSGSDIESGIYLGEAVPKYEINLPAEIKNSVITLGYASGVKLTVAGQVIDLSPIAEESPAYISLVVE